MQTTTIQSASILLGSQAAVTYVDRDEATQTQRAGGYEDGGIGQGSRNEAGNNGQERSDGQQGGHEPTTEDTECVKELLRAELVVSRHPRETWTLSPLGRAVFKGNELMFQRIHETYEACGGEWDGDTVRYPRLVHKHALIVFRLLPLTSDIGR